LNSNKKRDNMAGKTFGPSNAIDWAAYTEECERTNAQDKDRILHGAIGMMTEAGEILDIFKKHIFYGKPVDVVHLKEEIGDFFWYLAIWYHGQILNVERIGRLLGECLNADGSINLTHEIEIEERLKPWLAYRLIGVTCVIFGRDGTAMVQDYCPIEPPLMMIDTKEAESSLLKTLVCLMKAFHLEPSEVLEANSAKLRARYPEEGWNKERAENRNLAAERQVLEHGAEN